MSTLGVFAKFLTARLGKLFLSKLLISSDNVSDVSDCPEPSLIGIIIPRQTRFPVFFKRHLFSAS